MGVNSGVYLIASVRGEEHSGITVEGAEQMKRQTARNNEFLAGVKRMMNAKIYARTCKLMNSDPFPNGMGGGEGAAVMYLQQFFINPISRDMFVGFDGFGEN